MGVVMCGTDRWRSGPPFWPPIMPERLTAVAIMHAPVAMISDRSLRRVLPSDSSVALYGDLVRVLVAAAAVFVVLLYVTAYVVFARFMFQTLHMNDFGKFYYSAQAFLNGGDMYAPSPATAIPVIDEVREFANMNPPHFHLLVLPFARLSPLAAIVSW